MNFETLEVFERLKCEITEAINEYMETMGSVVNDIHMYRYFFRTRNWIVYRNQLS